MVMKRISLLLLAAVLAVGILGMPAAAAATVPPAGFTGVDSVDLEVDSGYAWHEMTDTEADNFELTEFKNSSVYLAGNSTLEYNKGRSVSNISIAVSSPGELTFEYAISAYEDDFLGWRIGDIITTGDSTATNQEIVIAAGDDRPVDGVWKTFSISVDESAFLGQTVTTIYIAFNTLGRFEGDTTLNYAAIRNVTYTTGNRSDVVQFESTEAETMGTVTAEQVTVTESTDDNGKVTTTKTYSAANVADLAVGNTYRLKATANSGYQFYGWIRHYIYNNKQYTAFESYTTEGMEITVDATTYYTPVFAAAGTYYIRNGTSFYTVDTPIDTVLNNAASGNTVVLLTDYTIPDTVTEVTVPAGVSFYIPFRDVWAKAEYEKTYHINGGPRAGISPMTNAYATLTIPATATLNVNGSLTLGAVRNYASQDGMQGHISGTFGRIENNGNIVMNSGSVVTCYGLIDGSGTLRAKDGSAVKESLIVSDFSGGNNSLKLYNQDQMPFKRYSAQNVQCKLQMEAKAKLSAMAVLYAMNGHNEVDVELFGSDSKVVFRTYVTGDHIVVLERSYNASKQISSGSGNNTAGIGTSTWSLTGGLEFQSLTISLAGVIELDTSRSPFPLPYNMHLVLNSGTYSINSGVSLLPGSSLKVGSDATIDLSGELYAYDGLVQSNMSGDKYPTRGDLTGAGFKGYGEFILNGKLYAHSGATVGGVIQTTGNGAMLTIEDGVYLNNGSANLMSLDATQTSFRNQAESLMDNWVVLGRNDVGSITTVNNWIMQDGGFGHYDDNTTWFNVPARIWNGTELMQLTTGTYLSKAGTSTTVSDTYVCRYVPEIAGGTESGGLTYNTSDGKRYMNDGTETFTRTVSGTWTAKSEGVEITSTSVAGSDKTGTLTEGVTLETAMASNDDGSYLLTIAPKKNDADYTTKMVYLIKCTNEDTSVTNAEATEGGWILPKGTVNITIECTVVGDTSGDGKIATKDLTLIRYHLLDKQKLDGIAFLAGDTSGDGKIATKDLTLVRYHLLNKQKLF